MSPNRRVHLQTLILQPPLKLAPYLWAIPWPLCIFKLQTNELQLLKDSQNSSPTLLAFTFLSPHTVSLLLVCSNQTKANAFLFTILPAEAIIIK